MSVIHYLVNQFLNATEGSAKQMQIIMEDHYTRLVSRAASDANVVPIRDRTEPIRDAFIDARAGYISAVASRKGATQAFEEGIVELSNLKIKQWDVQIQAVHLEGTSGYTLLLPNRRGPFQTGAYEDRLNQVRALGQRLTGIVALAATKTDVDAYYTTLKTLRDTANSRDEAIALASDTMENARIAAAGICYRNLGWLIDYYFATPEVIDNFYQFSLIMTTGSAPEEGTAYTGAPAGGATLEVAQRDFSTVSLIRLKNTGTATLKFCLGAGSAVACTVPAITVAPGTYEDVEPSDLGAGQYLNVTNSEPAIVGGYEVIVF